MTTMTRKSMKTDGVVEDILKKHGIEHLVKKFEDNKENDDDDEEGEDPFEFFSQFGEENKNLENRGIIFISGPISKETLSRAGKRLLTLHFDKEFKDDIQIIINSPGGFCDAGWAFIDLMTFCSNRIVTIAMGETCSMGTNIFIAGDHRIMAPNAQSMIHHFSWAAMGNYADLVAQRKAEDMEHQREMEHLLKCSKYKTFADVEKYLLLDQDHWLTPKEMKKHGLCDQIYTPKQMTKKGVEKRLAKAQSKIRGAK
jgi:ATP-dependent Clp protease, protease subunit